MKDNIDDLIDDSDTADHETDNLSEVPMMNDAELYGTLTPEMEKLLDTPVTLMAGKLYGMKDRRNTQDGDWAPHTFTWFEWLQGTLTKHPEAKTKEGPSLVFAESIGGSRKDSSIKTMASIGLDVDSGAKLDDVMKKLIELELFAIVYTSFSHGKTILDLKHDDVMRKLQLSDSPNRPQVQEYLRLHHKDRYDPEFIDSIRIVEARKQTADGLRIIVETPALDKFRVIIPLAEPLELSDLAPTVAQWKDAWADAVTGVAVNMLGIDFDATSTDVNRLFYTPRHPKGNDDWYCAVVQGYPLHFDEIVPYSKKAYSTKRDDNDPFAAGTGDAGSTPDVEVFLAPSGKHLNKWHTQFKERWLATDVIEAYCDDKIVKVGGERVGTAHMACPFEYQHSSTGGSATMVMNPLENEAGYWTIFCRHDACQGRHKLHFIQEMLEQGWIDEDVLENEDFLLPAEDDGEDIEPDDPLVIAETFGDKNDAEIVAQLTTWLKNGADSTMQASITKVIVANTDLGKRGVNALWKQARNKSRASARQKGKFPVVDLTQGHRRACDEAHALMINQGDKPELFQSGGRLVDIVEDERGNIRIREMTKDVFKAHIERKIDFANGESMKAAPFDLVNNVFYRSWGDYPLLDRITAVSVFTASGALIMAAGYHPESGLYYRPRQGFELPLISDAPTKKEALAARDLIVDLIADFPLGGLTRAQILDAVANGLPLPDLAHALSVALTSLVREMINGPTPGHLARKDKPRTGATLLMRVLAYIAALEHVIPQVLPSTKEEQEKTIVATLDAGSTFAFFDNLPEGKETAGGALASAMTSWPQLRARRLGSTAMVTVTVKCTWILTGNRTRMSEELANRMMLISLNPKMENPGDRPRDMFTYDLDTYVPANAGIYQHALLTMVQYWISQGRKEWTGKPLGGFERHAAVVGGILESVELYGFLSNRDKIATVVKTNNPDQEFLDALIRETNIKLKPNQTGTVFRVFGDEPVGTLLKEDVGTNIADTYEKHRVVSMMELLEREQIAPKNWGYHESEDGFISYPARTKGTVAQHIAALADTVREWGEAQTEKAEEQKRYIFTKVGKDRNSNLYAMVPHDLIR